MNLGLLFTFNIDLKTWVQSGLIDREKLIYESHIYNKTINKIFWFTYGYFDDLYRDKLNENIIIVKCPFIFSFNKISRLLYSFFLPFIHYKIIKQCDLIKTNQIQGSWVALLIKIFFRKKIIVRNGYVLTKNLRNEKDLKSRIKYYSYKLIEYLAFKYSNAGIVTGEQDKAYIMKSYYIKPDKLFTVYNYIDVNKFYDMKQNRNLQKIIFVGRLSKEKNLFNLIDAVSTSKNISLDIYGAGPLLQELISFAKCRKAKVNFLGVIPNNNLPLVYNRYKFYILSSLYEGMPKTLLEAMSCGLICIGTNVSGISEVIIDEQNGFLSKTTSSSSLSEAINRAIQYKDKDAIVSNAIQTIKQSFSLSVIQHKERDIFNGLLK